MLPTTSEETFRVFTISDVDVRDDGEGRFCLNDLHRASGFKKSDQPSNFMRRVETIALEAEIANSSDVRNYQPTKVVVGWGGGTYACKELVYAYSMWISPQFHLKVIRAYDAMVAREQPPTFHLPQTMAEALRLAADQAEEIERQQALIEQAKPKVEFVDKYVDATGLYTFRQVCKILGVKEREFRAWLVENKIMYQQGREWMAYSVHIAEGRFATKAGSADNGHAFTSTNFTAKGVQWIAKRWGGENMLAKIQDSI